MPDSTPAPVPARYRGVWTRTLLEGADRPTDTTTRVHWLQTPHWHGDLRVPADRPSFDGVTSLAACSVKQITWLLQQQGFAGVTTVRKVAKAEHCEWHRRIDFAASESRDLGRMVFDDTGCDEWGVEADYHERWERAPGADSDAPWLAVGRFDYGETEVPLEVGLRCGEWSMHLRRRMLPADATRAVMAALDARQMVPLATRVAAARFEISLARDGQVLLSTFPWREGTPCQVPADTDAALAAGWQPLAAVPQSQQPPGEPPPPPARRR